MAPNLLVALPGLLFVIALIGYACPALLKLSQKQEDAEHERVWRYLLKSFRP